MASDDEREVPMIDDTDIVVLPDQTADDIDSDWRDAAARKLRDLELLENRPPHWD
ncbi:hypothetical protein [Cryptosporangium aurantiacum]|uniref:Uncharacterized protein n=1 Tax=Cryptosporangium aurantiacum TaxID=134849 RepID=A0A1M7RK26_9ACTN|nr:hypothetical protein [Cryptosporangium aurantiacum]SHN46418.1 hypothetical protein SAMN05443668_115106 [Cryptosporangium aurantiacum]